MSDERVAEALRSDAPLVVIEAPAGFGKTHQGAEYARDLGPTLDRGRMLILTHTHAACDVFAARTKGLRGRVEIRTLYSLIVQIAVTYHECLALPHDVTTWAHAEKNGYGKIAEKVAGLLNAAPVIASALAARYPIVVCDEHQDSVDAQHRVILSLHRHGSKVRFFADPMQAIYPDPAGAESWEMRWADLQRQANRTEELTTPHRWRTNAPELGEWIRGARETLKRSGAVSLVGNLPSEISLLQADNQARRYGQFQFDSSQRRPIDSFIRNSAELLILAATNKSVRGLRSCFGRRMPIWEGHTRDSLEQLVKCCSEHEGDAEQLSNGVAEFLRATTVGLSDACRLLIREVRDGCATRRRGKPAKVQVVARRIVDSPDYRGAASAIEAIGTLVKEDDAFRAAKIDLPTEFNDAIRLRRFDELDGALAEMAAKRSSARRPLPSHAISTIHKAKGLERDNVLLMGCDRDHFADRDAKRRLLYVALSRATRRLCIVVPRANCSPLFRF